MLNTAPERVFGGPDLRYVIGVDEAGRGCMAGPVSVAAVCFDISEHRLPFNVEDSKVMSVAARTAAFEQLCEELSPDVASLNAAQTLATLCDSASDGRLCCVASPRVHEERTVLGFTSALVPAAEIDRVNILNATLEGMADVVDVLVRALRGAGERLSATNTVLLIDGPHRPWTCLPPEEHARKVQLARKRKEDPPRCVGRMYPETVQTLPCQTVVGGDGKYASIATASVVAKVTRDAYAERVMARECPQYGFAQHKGYCTPTHKKALAEHGLCVFHRREYAPVKTVVEAHLASQTRKKRTRRASE